MEVSAMFYICRYWVFTWWGRWVRVVCDTGSHMYTKFLPLFVHAPMRLNTFGCDPTLLTIYNSACSFFLSLLVADAVCVMKIQKYTISIQYYKTLEANRNLIQQPICYGHWLDHDNILSFWTDKGTKNLNSYILLLSFHITTEEILDFTVP